jgi:NHL repeat-containing protein
VETPSPSPPPCVQPSPRARTPGVSSADPVLLLAAGLNSPDDFWYYPEDGSVLVGEHGDGHLARITATGVTRLPQVVPEAEGIAEVNGVTYVADQYNARVVALTPTGVRTLLQLQPVASGENLDGISADARGTGLVVPDSPHGVVLFVDTNGHITGRVGGFSRPAGVAVDPQGGYLVADENASAVFSINGGRVTRIAGNLPGVDDVIRTDDGHVLVILPAAGRLFDLTAGRNVATGLRNPQGLGVDGAGNVIVTESDSGRIDVVVTRFALEVPSGVVQLAPGQGVCFGVVRAPGYGSALRVTEAVGADPVTDPGTGTSGEVVPERCFLPSCTVTLQVQGEFAQFSYRNSPGD